MASYEGNKMGPDISGSADCVQTARGSKQTTDKNSDYPSHIKCIAPVW